MTASDAPAHWAWLSARPNGVLAALTALQSEGVDSHEEETPTSSEIPVAIRTVVLVMELALTSGGAFLLLLLSSVIGTLARSLLLAAVGDSLVPGDLVARICETMAFAWGLVTFMSWFIRRSKWDLVQRVTRFGWGDVKTCIVSVLLHAVAIVVVALCQSHVEDKALVAWRNVESALHQSDGTMVVQNLLLAPLKEELLFRGMVMLVAINRLQSVKWSAGVSVFLFAAIHLANARSIGTQYSTSYVVFQVFWAFVVGLFLSLNFAVSGSLIECLVLHVINNVFALGVSKTIAIDYRQPVVYLSVLAALAIYSVAITSQLQLLRRTATSTKRL